MAMMTINLEKAIDGGSRKKLFTVRMEGKPSVGLFLGYDKGGNLVIGVHGNNFRALGETKIPGWLINENTRPEETMILEPVVPVRPGGQTCETQR